MYDKSVNNARFSCITIEIPVQFTLSCLLEDYVVFCIHWNASMP